MLPLSDLSVHVYVVYVLIDDAIRSGSIAILSRPGPKPACTDAEVLTIALVRPILGRLSEAAFLEEVRRDCSHHFPKLPVQSEFNRRVHWLWGAFEQLRRHLLAHLPEDCRQQLDTTALPVKHPSRVRGPDRWQGPSNLCADFGWDAAHHAWFYGFRLALRTELSSRLIRAWGIVPAAIDKRVVGDGLLEGAKVRGCCWTGAFGAGVGLRGCESGASVWCCCRGGLSGDACLRPFWGR